MEPRFISLPKFDTSVLFRSPPSYVTMQNQSPCLFFLPIQVAARSVPCCPRSTHSGYPRCSPQTPIRSLPFSPGSKNYLTCLSASSTSKMQIRPNFQTPSFLSNEPGTLGPSNALRRLLPRAPHDLFRSPGKHFPPVSSVSPLSFTRLSPS